MLNVAVGPDVGVAVSNAAGLTLTLGSTLGIDEGIIVGSMLVVGATLEAAYGVAVARRSAARSSRSARLGPPRADGACGGFNSEKEIPRKDNP